MSLTSRSIHDELHGLLSYLIGSEIALYVTPIAIDGDRVSWHSHRPDADFLRYRGKPTVEEYRHWIAMGAYSALLFDGSLLQITYEVADGEISAHRLAYVPAPFEFDQEMLQTEPFLDVVDLHMDGSPKEVILRSSIRFDFDPVAAAPGHPAVHLTFSSSDGRIACAGPLRLGRFVDFVFRHFHPGLWRVHPYFQRMPKSGWGGATLTSDDSEEMHFFWRV